MLAQKLNTHRRAGRRAAGVMQLRADAMKHFYRQQLIHHAHKFGDAEIVIIHFGQQLAH
ncbi:Uncharacterised protein [Salmonella enterica subsp. enterica serovar Bovismorbificans]|uniref:Uncharacterized protein n=1 Tax=Salmonella enterica subsp. enterica serovar Bovismorbificans TaxID=58097 RepID=A0A655CZQ9_SALET|nr:Uncharacterised protein [Salmonella enterica subsp. enterica serovar Bovismorbificans]CPR43285.1 Uncharacterised protein [Salmonella enterica subsp. enterica serovar Bovismorbificans]